MTIPRDTEISVPTEINIGGKGLLKKIIQTGISWQTPIPGDEVEGIYISYNSSNIPF